MAGWSCTDKSFHVSTAPLAVTVTPTAASYQHTRLLVTGRTGDLLVPVAATRGLAPVKVVAAGAQNSLPPLDIWQR